MNPVVHLELHTGDQPAASAFYEAVLGWHPEPVRAGTATYLTLGADGPVGAGVVGCGAARPLWLPYVAVADLERTTERARAMGAKLLIGPCGGRAGTRSVLETPSGGDIALWEPCHGAAGRCAR